MLIQIKQQVKIEHFREFCTEFKIKSDRVAGDDGSDEELIEQCLMQLPGKWLCTFVPRKDGYFVLYELY